MQTGSLEKFSEMVQEQILRTKDWSPLEVVLSMGAGATLLPYANLNWKAQMNNLIVHLLGASSTGKSTALKLFVGLGSCPEPKEGYWITYGSSDVSIIKRIGQNYGYPVGIDELSASSKKTMSQFVYTVGNGEEKDRLGAGGRKLQSSDIFQTVVMSTGEQSILAKCSKDAGVRVRCIELPGVAWTESKEQSVAIKECLTENYAVVTELLAKELCCKDEYWHERWNAWRKKVEEQMEQRKIRLRTSERISDWVVLFAMAAELFGKVTGVELHMVEIFEFLFQHIIIANEEEADMAVSGYAAIVDYISQYRSRFRDEIGYGINPYEDTILDPQYDGIIEEISPHEDVKGNKYNGIAVFRPDVVDRILENAGFSSPRLVLNQLREKKLLQTKDAKRNYSELKINGMKVKCIKVYIQDLTFTDTSLSSDKG